MTSPVTDPATAEKIFRDFLLNQLVPQAAQSENINRAADLVTRKPLPPSITKQPYAQYKEQLFLNAGSDPGELVIYGKVDDLIRDGECWAVFYSGLLSGGVSGCIDALTGQPVLVWVTPEG